MDDMLARYRSTLQASGHSNTTTRFRVFSTLSKSKTPMSLADLTQKLAGKADRSSIYRTVELFVELGIVKKVYTGWKYKLELGDDYRPHHHHVTCLGCDKVIPIESQELENALIELGRQNGFVITDHILELRGYCNSCQN